MILDRIIKGFWGRYVFYLSVFVVLYILMREKLDSIIFGLWDRWITVGEHPHISLYLFCLLSLYPIYRMLKNNKNKQMVDAAHVAYLFIPISAWYVIQMMWQTDKYYYLKENDAFNIILWFTVSYSIVLIILWFIRPKVDKNVKSLLLKDEPIEDEDKDELGFSLYADSISTQIRNLVEIRHPFVFGIEGGWGSGKTSFINLVKAYLEKDPAIRILDFNPWMSSSVQQMTTDFFSLMAESTPEMRLKMKFREYGKALATADGTGIVGKVVEGICPSQDLGTILEFINGCIKRQGLRFVVFIDDTDRLDKEELLAILKLVRNTAKFRNTVFVLTYDRYYVDSVLKTYFEDERIGKAYPDKIVNFQFELPSSAKDYYEILKKEINNSIYIKAHNEIRLNDEDLQFEVTSLFDNYRKVKRVFNALAVESVFPHFEKIPVKYTLVFFYISYYRKDEYEMIKEAYLNIDENQYVYEFLYDNDKINQSLGERLLRIIEHNNQIIKPKFRNGAEQLTEKEIKEELKYNRFKEDHKYIYTFLNDENIGAFIKYLDFLFKFNAVHYKEYKEKYETYDIDGYKDIKLEFSDAEKILNRLTVISKEFPKAFYKGCSDELIKIFINEDKVTVKEEDLQKYYQFLFGIILNSDNYAYLVGFIIHKIEEHFKKYGWEGEEIFNTLNLIDDIRQTDSNTYTQYYSIFTPDIRYNLASSLYQGILHNLIKSLKTLPYKSNDILEEASKHLQRSINNKLGYTTIEYALMVCYKSIDPQTDIVTLSPDACRKFRSYIEESPDDFIHYCIRSNGAIDDFKVTYHFLLLQIFENDKLCIRQYFKNAEVKIKSDKNKKICSIIRKYINKYLSDKIQKTERKLFQISDEDFDFIFEKKGNNAVRK
jgi:KAP family P-loop domain.